MHVSYEISFHLADYTKYVGEMIYTFFKLILLTLQMYEKHSSSCQRPAKFP